MWSPTPNSEPVWVRLVESFRFAVVKLPRANGA